jgi:formylmethanofuran dehydrogenase subunit E
MKTENAVSENDFQKCVDFHGHICPGLAMGYKASKAGLEWLRAQRAGDEEIVAIVETDACCADAVQVLTGCTFGKGNFIYKDHGKVAFTFFSRNTGNGVRLALKPDVFVPDERHMELIVKIREDTASEAERNEFQQLHEKKSNDVLDKPVDELFAIKEVTMEPPEKAMILPSKPCSCCGEPTMVSKLKEIKGKLVCCSCE